jgi:ABC-2 type transport system permease protein
MSSLGNIIAKEIKELLTPATFIPIIFMAIIFASMGNTLGGIEEQLEEPAIIGLINEDSGNLSKIATTTLQQNSKVIFNSTKISDKQEAIDILKEKDGVALIIIKENFTENILSEKPGEFEIYWIMKGAGIMDTISSAAMEGLMNFINTNITVELITAEPTINASTILNPTVTAQTTYFKDKELTDISPGEITNLLSSQSMFIPIIMMMIIMFAGQMVISSMALEKENKTLETLLTLPVKRTSIVAGKIIASAVIGLILAVIYMIGLGFMMQSFQVSGGKNLASYGLFLSTTDLLIIGITVFVTLLAALAFCMLLGTMAKNFKSAQTLAFPVVILTLIPMFLTMFKDFDTLPFALKTILFGIPFSHPMMAPRALIFDDYMIVFAGIIYVTIFALIMISISVWVFKTDRLLTGTIKKKFEFGLFKKRF